MLTRRAIPPEQLLALLEQAIQEAPALLYEEALSESDVRWLGKADALIEASGSMSATLKFRTARNSLHTYAHSRNAIMQPLYDAHSRVELLAPQAMRGRFIAGGDTWNGYVAIVEILQTPCEEILIVDPYLNSIVYLELSPHLPENTQLKCLAIRRPEYHAGIVAAAAKWASDTISQARSVEFRYAQAGSLHDRLIIIDKANVWLISQSIKDIAKKSPASILKADPELANIKADHYLAVWEGSLAVDEG